MKEQNSILTAPETMNVSSLLELYHIIQGNDAMTLSNFYYFLTTPSIERDEFLLKAKSIPALSGNLIRQQFIP